MFVGLLPWGRALLLGKSAPLSPVYDAIKVPTEHPTDDSRLDR